MAFLRALVPALLSGVLFAAALPPVGQWWLAWFWMLPLLWKLWPGIGTPTPRRLFWYGFRHGWLAGFFVFTGTLWWVAHVTGPGMIAMCLYLALYPAIWGGCAALLRPESPGRGLLAALVLALLWVGLELIRSRLLTGFPWNGAAVPLAEMPGLRALAAWTGVTGLAAVPVFFMSGLAAAWVLRGHRKVRGRAVLLGITLGLPPVLTLLLWEKSPQSQASLQVMLVQPNFPRIEPGAEPEPKTDAELQELRARWDREDAEQRAAMKGLTLAGMAAARTKPQLVVWPESALPGYYFDGGNADLFAELFEAGMDTLLTGADSQTPDANDDKLWHPRNCAVLLRRGSREVNIYEKVHLVPFGEYLPLRKQIPLLEQWLGHLIPRNFEAGSVTEPLYTEGLPCEIIPLICFEDTIARVARKFVKPVPQVIVNITNDNWFYQSNESAIHALNARWRCIELRRPMVRASLTGVTCVIDTEGRVTDEMPRWRPGVLHATVSLPPGEMTFFAEHGDLLSIWFGAGGVFLGLIFVFTRSRHET
jgi:apolipoprotein N-acyltransferase